MHALGNIATACDWSASELGREVWSKQWPHRDSVLSQENGRLFYASRLTLAGRYLLHAHVRTTRSRSGGPSRAAAVETVLCSTHIWSATATATVCSSADRDSRHVSPGVGWLVCCACLLPRLGCIVLILPAGSRLADVTSRCKHARP